MKSKVIYTTVLNVLSLQCLLGPIAHAKAAEPSYLDSHSQRNSTQDIDLAHRIIQKRIVGFDPKQAVETLTYLYNSGVQSFEKDGSVYLDKEMVVDVMEVASVDGIEVRILAVENETAKIKFAAHDPHKFDRARIAEAKELADIFQLKCDMDGKML